LFVLRCGMSPRTFLFARIPTTGCSSSKDIMVVNSSEGGSLVGPFLDHAGSTLVEPALDSHIDVEGRGPETTLRFNGAVSLGGGLACF
jgi:hypothetical protein